MRVAPRELRGVSRDGVLVRFAVLGPVAYVEVDIPRAGSAGTGFETPSQNPGWGFVLRGHVTLHGQVTREFTAGTAFYIPPGAPDHHLTAAGGTIVAGFVPVAPDLDTSDRALRRQGFRLASTHSAPTPLLQTIRSLEPSRVLRKAGTIDVESAPMGEWLFMRTTYGPMSGYTGGWCDLPHWGLVLRGDLTLTSESDVELLSSGDVYYCPAGPPGHAFQVPDSATSIDYTPVVEFGRTERQAERRNAAWRQALRSGLIAPDPQDKALRIADAKAAAGTVRGTAHGGPWRGRQQGALGGWFRGPGWASPAGRSTR
ncbi:MAG: cupin domain-containing protein [Chloroflexi bacterium]|nr:cupin domain-containing protein [Chloroflexota bacterium]